jgi:phosphoglycerate dehydrogenase-like enzyme
MIGGQNPNHPSFYEKQEVKAEVKEDKKEEVVKDEIKNDEVIVIEKNEVTKDYLYSMSKAEQIFALQEIGLSASEIKKLKKEKDRVEMLYELLN